MSEQIEQPEAPEEAAAEAAQSNGEAEAAEAVGQPEAQPTAEAEAAAEVSPTPAEEPVPAAAPAGDLYKIPEAGSKLSRPQVVDLRALLKPVSADNPAGEYLRYSGIYDEINEARRADDNLAQGEWQHELKLADYRRVIDLAIPALENETKDLQLAALLSEALVREHGFAGLRDSLRLLAGLQVNFWESLHPEIYEGDMEGRANALSLVDSEGGLAIQRAPITPDGYSYLDFLDSKKYDFPDDINALSSDEAEKARRLEAEAVRLNKVTGDKWEAEISKSRRAFYEELNVAILECFEALSALNLTIEDKFDINQAPSLRALKKVLDDIKTQTDKILELKRQEEPDEVEADEEESAGGAAGTGGASASGAVQSRAEALRRLSELAAFFRKTEPHSPVSYLVTRAVKWGNMPLESWLKDVIKDEAILFNLRQTLGFNTSDEESGQAEGAAE
ncbi:MAG: type VI secretion system protein TssA [Acidobacteriota bacterium]|nr:MAG: type VI secretion system protein TssA [Acidobacteriota bacterium]